MNNDTYPLPKRHRPKQEPLQYRGEFGNSQQEWEEMIFRNAVYFTVVRFGTHNGSESTTCATFPQAIKAAAEKPRSLIYAVSDKERAFCIPTKDYEKFAGIWMETHK